MRKSLFLGIAVLACAGCGTATKTVTQTVTAAGAPPTTATTTTSTTETGTTDTTASSNPDGNCQKVADPLEIPNGTRCKVNGSSVRFAQQDHPLRLKSLTASVEGVRTADSLHSSYDGKTAEGRFVIVTLTILNRADSPQTFESIGGQAQTVLLVQKKQFTESFDAENGPDANSCVSKDDAIQPDATRTCDVVFDIPTALVNRARAKPPLLLVANFGDDLTASYDQPSEAGAIVLRPLGGS